MDVAEMTALVRRANEMLLLQREEIALLRELVERLRSELHAVSAERDTFAREMHRG
jgi:hypothetical protein